MSNPTEYVDKAEILEIISARLTRASSNEEPQAASALNEVREMVQCMKALIPPHQNPPESYGHYFRTE